MINVIDLLFPKICVGCAGEGSWLCSACEGTLLCMQGVGCPSCEKVTWDNHYCQIHQTNHLLTGLFFVDYYREPLLRDAIQGLKYEKIRELATALGRVLQSRITYWPQWNEAILIPIPLHHHRLRERGFNQAELVARQLKMPVIADALVRHRKTVAQATLSDKERLTNLENVFGVHVDKQSTLHDKIVLLIDDVYTTGTTMEQAARVLLRAGVREVWGAVLAKS